jgi:hypothetical protein
MLTFPLDRACPLILPKSSAIATLAFAGDRTPPIKDLIK